MAIIEYKVGECDSITREITEADVASFAEITGDCNPIHTDEAFALSTPQKGRIVHGLLLASCISAVIASKLPGVGTLILGLELRFIMPARIGDVITSSVRIREVLPEQSVLSLSVSCTNQAGNKLVTGTATVMPPIE